MEYSFLTYQYLQDKILDKMVRKQALHQMQRAPMSGNDLEVAAGALSS